MDKDINKDNAWAKMLKEGKVPYDTAEQKSKIVLSPHQFSERQMRGVRRAVGE